MRIINQFDCRSICCFVSVCFLTLCVTAPAPLFAGEVEAFHSHQSQSLQAVKEKYNKIKEQYPDNGDLKKFDQRIKTIDEVAVRIIKQYDSIKSQAMQNMVSVDIIPIAAPTKKTDSLSALDLLTEYETQFSQPLPVPEIDPSLLPVLKEYYDRAIQSAMDFIIPRGCSAAIVSKTDAADTLSLTMVIHFLHIGDSNWNKACIERLPDLMKKPATMKTLEDVCFKMRRPRTAYQFFLYRTNSESFDPDYFLQSTDRLLAINEYISAIRCLTAGLEIAEENECNKKAVPLAVKLADVYYTMGHLSLAIEAMEEVLQQEPQNAGYCKAAALQLKYLYEDGNYKEVTTKASSYLEKQMCEPYQPDIMYISWLASRRDNLQDLADELKKKFLEKYPQNSLCANMLFDSAINALANTNYSQAREILEQIEYHYSGSKIISKVRDLKERLSNIE